MPPADSPATANFEVRFMTGMVDHHQMAIEMARLCLARAIHPELEAMCESIIAAQSSEIETMQGWLLDWYGITYEPVMKPGDQRMLERLALLSGEEFEVAFMDMMINTTNGRSRKRNSASRRRNMPRCAFGANRLDPKRFVTHGFALAETMKAHGIFWEHGKERAYEFMGRID